MNQIFDEIICWKNHEFFKTICYLNFKITFTNNKFWINSRTAPGGYAVENSGQQSLEVQAVNERKFLGIICLSHKTANYFSMISFQTAFYWARFFDRLTFVTQFPIVFDSKLFTLSNSMTNWGKCERLLFKPLPHHSNSYPGLLKCLEGRGSPCKPW